mmetsp:Transcript_46627/g.72994  ORF Transcript_46627/g.72994 Transcript_46627/m.72994 type:complete len:508 (+) Transcript_46627:292-1815(+)|eukprot:CAMPEP_0184292194 /NCGR_PEP_ID=MMETSP1049-20130417/4020_1 /TAXON_ID=77928 /ORGANISM="Proteomonas sulcata, Strain CCMP704" /LENGTH=507 /DNA_ID=CAMNT_0026599883 /DNA_START=185 /DNA_END=1708 /DNA_ORIENTATION=-
MEDGHISSDVTAPFSPRSLTGLVPTIELEGTSGVYLLKNEQGQEVAVFKPMDEEKMPEEASKWALVSGTAYFRERAAFLVSSQLGGFSGVPNTIIASIPLKGEQKVGSLQRFVPASIDMSDLGPADIPVDEVHKIGALDILLFNMDRHEGNLLLRRVEKPDSQEGPSRELVPIDHGLSLPVIIDRSGPKAEVMSDLYFAWQSWPQAKQPFGKQALQMLSSLNTDAVGQMVEALRADLGNQSLMLPALTTLKVGAMLLRTCAIAGMSLSDISEFVRQFLASLLQAAWISADATTEELRDGKGIVVPAGGYDLDIDDRLYIVWESRLLAELQKQLQLVVFDGKPVEKAQEDAVQDFEADSSVKVEVIEVVSNDPHDSRDGVGVAPPTISDPVDSHRSDTVSTSVGRDNAESFASTLSLSSDRFEQLGSPLNSPKTNPVDRGGENMTDFTLSTSINDNHLDDEEEHTHLHAVINTRIHTTAHHPTKRGHAASHVPALFLGKDLHPMPQGL